MSNRIRCDVRSWDETKRALAALDAAITDAVPSPPGIGETAWTTYAARLEHQDGTSIIGDGTIEGHWKRWGNTVLAAVSVIPGAATLTTYAPEPWFFTLPLACTAGCAIEGPAFVSNKYVEGDGYGGIEDWTSVCRYLPLFDNPTGTSRVLVFTTDGVNGAVLRNGFPWTFPAAFAQRIDLTITYPTSGF